MINVWHQSTARVIRKLKDSSAFLLLSRYFDVILLSAASSSGAALYSRRYDGSAQFVLLSTFFNMKY